MTFEQLTVIKGDDKERTRLQYRSHGEKNHGSGLKHRNVTPKLVEQHENVEKPERCVVRLYNNNNNNNNNNNRACIALIPKNQGASQYQTYIRKK